MSIDIRAVGAAQGETADQHRRAQARDAGTRAEAVLSAPQDKAGGTAAGELEKAVSDVQIYLKRLNTELRFEVDRDLKEVTVRIVDPETNEVIRQIPSEELINIRKRMKELVGVLYRSDT